MFRDDDRLRRSREVAAVEVEAITAVSMITILISLKKNEMPFERRAKEREREGERET